MSVHLHNPLRLLSELSNRKKWAKHKQHHILASNNARASLTNQLPFSSSFPSPPSPFHTNSSFHHSPPHPQIRKRWLTLQASKQASKRPYCFRNISKFSHWCLQTPQLTTYMHVDFIYTNIPTYKRREIKYFLCDTSHAYRFIRSFSRPSCDGRTSFLTPCMHAEIRCTVTY